MLFRSSQNSRRINDIQFSLIRRGASICLLLAASPLLASAPSNTGNPRGGNVTQGGAVINNTGNMTTIRQSTDKAVIDWNSFSIGKGHTTQFIDPSASAITLNRVTGNNTSLIMGTLLSNGQVFIMNPNGIVFGKGSHVDVGGLLASTANISNNNFMNGNYHFMAAPANSYVINDGVITVAKYGLAALVAPTVENNGVINATLGKVILGAGNAFTLDLYGDGLINFDVSSNGFLVNNTGAIFDRGGTVLLTAAAAGALLENTINTSGIISAQSVAQHDGKIILQGSMGTTVNMSGLMDVSGIQKGLTGGLVQVSADQIILNNNSVINATGYSGGGTVEIGGGPQGTGPLAHAQTVTMDSGASIDAGALQSGNGGHVVFWSDALSNIYGKISAMGGVLSGNGGLIETSGDQLNVTGIQVNTSALHGLTGNWLLDPWDITVVNGSGVTNGSFSGTTFVPSGTSTIGALTLSSQLATTNVTLDTCGGSGGCPGTDAGNITFNNNTDTVSVGNNAFNVYASNNIVMNYNNVITGSGTGQITLWTGRQNTGAGTMVLNGGVTQAIAGGNPLQIYYNPSVFGTNDSDIADINPSATANAYSLVYSGVGGRQLSNINAANLGGNYVLAQNIDGSLLGSFTPIGALSNFTGNFLGNGFTINDLNVAANTAGTGLFGQIDGATISDVTLTNSIINGGGNSDVGGIVGFAFNSTLNNLTGTNLTVSGFSDVGGIVGTTNFSTTMTNIALYSTTPASPSVSGSSSIGGIVGNNSGTLSQAFSNATVQITNLGGGLVGSNSGTINNVMFAGNVIAQGAGASEIGGLIGFNNGSISNALAAGTLTNNGSPSPGFGAIISGNSGTVSAPVYYSTTSYGGSVPGIYAGTGVPNFGGAIVGSPSSSLTSPLNGLWQQNNTSFQFTSLSFCGSACIINFASPPPPPPTPPSNSAVTSTQSLLNNSNPTPPDLDLNNGNTETVGTVPSSQDPNSDNIVVTVTPDKLGAQQQNPAETAKLGEHIAKGAMCK